MDHKFSITNNMFMIYDRGHRAPTGVTGDNRRPLVRSNDDYRHLRTSAYIMIYDDIENLDYP